MPLLSRRPAPIKIPDDNYTVTRSGKKYAKNTTTKKVSNKKSLSEILLVPAQLDVHRQVRSDIISVYSHVLFGVLTAYLAFCLNRDTSFLNTPEAFILSSLAYLLCYPSDGSKGYYTVLYGLFTSGIGIILGSFFDYYNERPKRNNSNFSVFLGILVTSFLTNDSLLRTDTSKSSSKIERYGSVVLTGISSMFLLQAITTPRPLYYIFFLSSLGVTSMFNIYFDARKMLREFDSVYSPQKSLSIIFNSMNVFMDVSLFSIYVYLSSLEYNLWA